MTVKVEDVNTLTSSTSSSNQSNVVPMSVCAINIENANGDSKRKLEEMYSTISLPPLIQNTVLDCQEPNSYSSSMQCKNDAEMMRQSGLEHESNNGKVLEDPTEFPGECAIQNEGGVETLEVKTIATTSDNILATPTLSMRSMEFSPLLTFSEDREIAQNDVKIPNHANVTKAEARVECDGIHGSGYFPSQGQQMYGNDNDQRIHFNHCQDVSPHLSSNLMTYADSLIHHSTTRVLPNRPPIIPIARKPLEKKNIGNKKRKAATASRIRHRQPQKRFSIDMKSTGVEDSLFGAKNNGQVRLTTNKAREVEALDPVTRRRIHLYASCSEAARIIKVNRTRVSRTCRNGGGKLGDYFYRYREMEDESQYEEMQSEPQYGGIQNQFHPDSISTGAVDSHGTVGNNSTFVPSFSNPPGPFGGSFLSSSPTYPETSIIDQLGSKSHGDIQNLSDDNKSRREEGVGDTVQI